MRRRRAGSSRRGVVAMSRSNSEMRPREGRSARYMSFKSVLLPAPLRPVRKWKEPGGSRMLTSRSTSGPAPYRMPTFSNRTKERALRRIAAPLPRHHGTMRRPASRRLGRAGFLPRPALKPYKERKRLGFDDRNLSGLLHPVSGRPARAGQRGTLGALRQQASRAAPRARVDQIPGGADRTGYDHRS